MKIILAGAGEVGYHLAKELSIEKHDISVIDVNSEQLERVNNSTDVLTIQGSSTNIGTLKRAKIENTDLLVAVTSSESININTAILGKKLGAHKTIARVSNAEYVSPEYIDLFASLGIDHLIYPEELAAFEIVKLIERAAATDVLEFEEGKISLLGLRIDKSFPYVRNTVEFVAERHRDISFRVVAIQRGFNTIIPTGEDIFLPNDQIFTMSTPEGIEKFLEISGKNNVKIDNIMILGGGKIGRKTAKLLESSINIKIIESDKDKSVDLADYLEKSLIIQGDGRDIDLLAQEGIIDMDAFLALTNDAETNIITCLMAKHLGVSKTIALVDNVDYIPLTQTIGLDSLINKKLIAANNITRFIRKTSLVSIATLQGIDAEVFEYIAKKGSPITSKKVKEIKFPKDAILGGYIRGDKGFIVTGNTEILPEDKVVVFALPGVISKIEKYFN